MDKQHRLTDTRCRNTKPSAVDQKLTDGGGLYLLIKPSGSRFWRYRYEIAGNEGLFALGKYCPPASGETDETKATRLAAECFSLVEARAEHLKAKQLVKAGIHPLAHRKEQKRLAARNRATTLEGVAREWLERAGSKWRACPEFCVNGV